MSDPTNWVGHPLHNNAQVTTSVAITASSPGARTVTVTATRADGTAAVGIGILLRLPTTLSLLTALSVTASPTGAAWWTVGRLGTTHLDVIVMGTTGPDGTLVVTLALTDLALEIVLVAGALPGTVAGS